jgi:hypothetical protein
MIHPEARPAMTRWMFPLLLVVLAAPGLVAVAPATAAVADDLDVLLVRRRNHDLLVLRPWFTDPPPSSIWMWPAPAGAAARVDTTIAIEDMRGAVWAGYIPLSPPNAEKKKSACEMAVHMDRALLPARALGVFATLPSLMDAAADAGVAVTDGDRVDAEALLATGRSVAVLAWRSGPASGTGTASPMPAPAMVLSLPGHLDELPLEAEAAVRGCMGRVVAVGPRPVVPGPGTVGYWKASLLPASNYSEARRAARLAGADEAGPDWAVTSIDLDRCDGAAALHPVLLDLARDLTGPMARVAASWCAQHPGPDKVAALTDALSGPLRGGDPAAFVVWAAGQQGAAALTPALERWTESGDDLVRGEAYYALAVMPPTASPARCLDLLDAFVVPDRATQALVDVIGYRLVNAGDADLDDRLEAFAHTAGGWLEWRFGERLGDMRPRDGGRPYDPAPDELTAGAWAVAALASRFDPDALECLTQSLVESAVLAVAGTQGPRRGCWTRHGVSSDSWSGWQVLFPRESALAWPTLHRVGVALAEQPRARDAVLRLALRDPRLPDEAALVLMAGLVRWMPPDEARATAILQAGITAGEASPVRFFGIADRRRTVDVPLPLPAVTAAYVLGQRGATAPLVHALDLVSDPALRAEIAFALALAPERDVEATRALEAWGTGVTAVDDDSVAAIVDLAAERVALARRSQGRGRGYEARFTADPRPRRLR